MIGLREIARALGGEVSGAQVVAPGPGHDRRDRSLAIKLSATSPDGFLAHSFAGDDWRTCRDHVRDRLGLPRDDWKRDRERPALRPAPQSNAEHDCDRVRWLWRQRRPVVGSIAEVYLREARGYDGLIPPTLAYLPPRDGHEPALMAPLGIATEPEPGRLAIADAAVMAVQLVKLKPDGSGKADVEPNKVIIGKGALGSPIVCAPPNDLLSLAITEGLEDALSIYEATGLGAWASGGASRMPALAGAVPRYVECVTVLADDDAAGLRHGADLASGLRTRGFETILKPLSWEQPR